MLFRSWLPLLRYSAAFSACLPHSVHRRGSGDEREEEATAILWTLWGKQAENAAEYLSKGSHVNIVGRLRNNNYQDAEGKDVYGLAFIAEEVDYLESKAQSDARRSRAEGEPVGASTPDTATTVTSAKGALRSAKPRTDTRAAVSA